MPDVLTAIISVTALGLVCAVLLTLASKLMAVQVDERLALIRECLPGANCGACGFTGCDGYASALLSSNAEANLCTPGGNAVSKQLSSILGAENTGNVIARTAIVHCMGDSNTTHDKMVYTGIRTCAAAVQLYGGKGACTFGCIGYGDCAVVCPEGAICIEKELAHVDKRKCIGCGICAKACPGGVISTEAEPVSVAVLCRNTEKGAQLKDKCSKGCIGCMRCAKECPNGAITVNESLAAIDNNICIGCKKCIEVCVKGCIVKLSI